MPLPQVGGSQTVHSSGNNTAVFDISAIPNGAWMILSAMWGTSTNSVTSPAGWTAITSGTPSGSRTNFLYAKNKEESDGSSLSIDQTGTNSVSYALLWGIGGAPVANWVIGTQWTRDLNSLDPSGARYTNIAPSIATVEGDFLAVAISHESTNAFTAGTEITSTPLGWQQRVSLSQVALNSRVETIWIGTKELTSAGDSGDASITYIHPQDSNGWAVQIAIPSADIEVTPSSSPEIVGIPSVYIGSSNTSFTIDRPMGTVSGDYIVVALRGQSSTMTVAPSSPGFTYLGPSFEFSSGAHRVNGLYGRPIPDISSEPTSYEFSFESTGANNRIVATAFIVRGVDLETPLAGSSDTYSGRGVTGGKEMIPYTLNSLPVLGIFFGASEFAAPNNHTPTTLPDGYAAVSEVVTTTNTTVSRTYLWVGAREITTNVDTVGIYWDVSTSSVAQGIALRGSSSVNPTDSGFVARDGSGQEVQIYHITPEGARTPTAVVPMRRGFNSVAEMLATPGVTWAHRGGSASYPEMSLHAYTQSVARGYGVLEVSMGRTSDGVWFGLHDQTTDRTSGGNYGNASSQTWAQIQAQQNVAGPGAPQPYMRWEELVERYGSTHIIMADLKHALAGYRTEFLNMVYNDLGPSRAIIKFSGSGSGSAVLANEARALGFETWGYFYAADASIALGGNGNMQTWANNWTMLGMEHSASQAVWDEALSFGKPVYGHIIPNQAAYSAVMAKGARGAQVSAVATVQPVSWWTQ